MTCDRSPHEIQQWLDGDLDLSSHASECPSCQSQMSLSMGLRRLSAPPSPLGKDFARRTAARVIERSRLTPAAPKSGWKLLWSNPLLSILQRQSQLRLNRLPSLALLCLLFSPGLFFQSSGDSRSAYLLVLQLGLGLGIPLLALARDLTTLSGLIKGRCLEEMVQAGTPAPTLVDTLLVHGLRHLGMALGLSALFLTGLDGGEFARHLPLILAGYLVLGYLGSSQILSRSTGLSLAGLAVTWLTWGTAWVYFGLLLTAGLARSSAIKTLTALSQGQVLGSGHRPAPVWQKALGRYLPDWALLQRELARQPLFSLAWLALQAVGIREAYLNPGAQPIWLGLLSMAMACQVSLREMQNGTLEMLGQSGLKPRHWWQSLGLLNVLKLAPMLLTFTLTLAPSTSPSQAFCHGLLLLICSACATLIGTVITLRSHSQTQVWQAGLRESLWFFASTWVLYGVWLNLLNGHEWLRSGLVPEWLVAAAPSVLVWVGRAHLYRKSQVIWWPSLPLVIVASVIPLRFFGDALMSSNAHVRDSYFGLFSLTAAWSCLWVWAQSPAPVPLWRLAFSNLATVLSLSYASALLMMTTGWADPFSVSPISPWWPALVASLGTVGVGLVLNGRALKPVSPIARQVARARNRALLWIGATIVFAAASNSLYQYTRNPLSQENSWKLEMALRQMATDKPVATYLSADSTTGLLCVKSEPNGTSKWVTVGGGGNHPQSGTDWTVQSPKPIKSINQSSRLVDWHNSQLAKHLSSRQAEPFVKTLESLAPFMATPSVRVRLQVGLGFHLHLSQALAQGRFDGPQLHRVKRLYDQLPRLSASKPTFDVGMLNSLMPLTRYQGIFPEFVLKGWRNHLIGSLPGDRDFVAREARDLARFEREHLVLPAPLMQKLFRISLDRVEKGKFPDHWVAPNCSYQKLSSGFLLDYQGEILRVKIAPERVEWELNR